MPEYSQGLVTLNPDITRPSLWTPSSEPIIGRFSPLPNYVYVLLRYRWLIFGSTLLVAVVTAIYSFTLQPVYRATSRLEIEPESPLIKTITDLFRDSASIDEETFLSTQVDVIQSDSIAWSTIEQLQLAKRAPFKTIVASVRNRDAQSALEQNALTREFKKHLVVERQRNTRIMQIHFDASDPHLAALAVNTVVDNYIAHTIQVKRDASRQVTAWMEQQLSDLRKKVEASQELLVRYEAKNSLMNVGERESLAEQKLSDLMKNLTEAQNDRVRKESVKDQVNSDLALVHFASDSPLLQQLQESEARLRTEYVDASQAYGPMFPKVKRLQAQVDEVQSLIGREQKRIIEAINHDYTAAKTRESLLSDAVAKQKAEVARLNELAIRHNLLRRDFQSNQALYDNLMQQMKDAMVSAGLRITNVQMLDRAFPPAEADRPRRARNIMVGSVAGIILGFLCSLMRETIDTSVKRAEELEVLTGVPTFSIIPDAMKVRKSSGKRRCMQPSHRSVSKALLSYPESALAESFRALRTSILLSKTDGAPQVLLVTSPNAREGKTCTAVNLAMALAQKGDQVLLVDADFRRPTAGIIFGISNNSGLSGILTGASELGQAVVQFAQLETLSVLPAGPYPQNAAELLSSAAMPKLVAELRPRFKYIVIDAPPVLLITDATILASIADGVIMVAVSEVTKRGALLRAFRIISLCQGRILGSVLNKVDVRRNGYYGYYYSRTSNHGIVDLQTSG